MPKVRQSLFLSIVISVFAILCTIAILVGWSILFTKYYALWTQISRIPDLGVSYWLSLVLGCMFLVGIMAVLVFQLIANIQKTLYVRQQDTFIDGVTHEFKSPLASLRVCLETMEMRELTPEMQRRFVEMMQKDVERLIAFVEHILEAGRLEHNQRELRFSEVSIPTLARRCVDMIKDRYQLSAAEVKEDISLSPSCERVVTDAVALETILINLLDNAVKYSEHPIEVELSVTSQKDTLVFEVSDHGQGIPKRFFKQIFRRFYRIRNEKHPNARGTGLGLYLVSFLVKRLGGSISVHSDGEGQGSTFCVKLPAMVPQAVSEDANLGGESVVEAPNTDGVWEPSTSMRELNSSGG